MKVLNALAAVRASPKMYLGCDGLATGPLLLSKIATDPIFLAAFPITVDLIDEWWIVASPKDWIVQKNVHSIKATFEHVIAFPEAGPNSMRSEVLLTAFADGVVTYGLDGKTVIKGCEQDVAMLEQVIERKYAGHRVVAFCIQAAKYSGS